eukprot:1383-Chlamydomonas_euryale.AAC.1
MPCASAYTPAMLSALLCTHDLWLRGRRPCTRSVHRRFSPSSLPTPPPHTPHVTPTPIRPSTGRSAPSSWPAAWQMSMPPAQWNASQP